MTGSLPSLAGPTLPHAFLERVRGNPNGTALVIVRPDADDLHASARELLDRSTRFAEALRSVDARSSVVAVCLYHGVDLYAAFLGAMLAGHVPTMIAPPSPRMERHKYIDSFVRMLDHIRPAAVVSDPGVTESLREFRADALEGQRLLDPSEILDAAPNVRVAELPEVDPSAVALLQHSSGTTGLQKGIALTHRAILNQLRSYSDAISLTHEDRVASWLPLYHDMGLIACFLLPILSGVPIVQISPFDWVLKPAVLLDKVTEHRATLCWLPNFAFAFLSRSVRDSQLESLDLRSVRAFINCSEPVMAESQDRFVERFASVGASEAQIAPCYAMAENVFAVTQSPIGQAARRDRVSRSAFQAEHRAVRGADGPFIELVSNGPAIDGVEVRVVDDEGSVCKDDVVGQIEIRGESLFDGYYGREDLTREAFDGDWYRTGDLGYLADGELYVTGRLKDLIILQGRNFYPSDLEAAISDLEGVIDGRVAAFGHVDETQGTETLVLIAETALEDDAGIGRLKLAIRNCIAQSFDCTATQVHCVPPRWLVKSTAGKVARADNRRKFEEQLER